MRKIKAAAAILLFVIAAVSFTLNPLTKMGESESLLKFAGRMIS